MSDLFSIAYTASQNGTDFTGVDRIIKTVSALSGYLSVCIWLFAQLPQIIENHLNQSVEGVSVLFLGIWMSGDLTNLIGCLLTGALPFQTALASYYCFIDLILGFQYWFYSRVYPYQKVPHNLLQSPDMMRLRHLRSPGGSTPKHGDFAGIETIQLSPMQLQQTAPPTLSSFTSKLVGALFLGAKKASALPIPLGTFQDPLITYESPKNIPDSHDSLKDRFIFNIRSVGAIIFTVFTLNKETVGRILAWTCLVLYISSRTPQILENHRKKSTKGISLYLFLFAMIGNTLYTICVCTDLYLITRENGYQDEIEFQEALLSQLPFILGSAGTVTFDCIILFQCWLYKNSNLSPPRVANRSHTSGTHRRHKGVNDHFKKPDWYTNSGVSAQEVASQRGDRSERTVRNTEVTPLMASFSQVYLSNQAPSHYMIGSVTSNTSEQHKTGALNSISNSIMKSLPMSAVKSPNSDSNGGISPNSTSLIPLIVGTYSSLSKKMTDDAKIPFLPQDFLTDDFHFLESSSIDNTYQLK